MEDSNPESVETLVVGGGVNGTSVASELKDQGYDDFVVADPEGYGGRLMDYADSIGMESMRSPMEHNVDGSEEASLREYAFEEGRPDEIEDGRPSIELFRDHWSDTVESYDLEEHLYQNEVEGLEEEDGFYRAVIDGQEVEAENVVLATGKGPLNYPDYAEELPDEAEAYHAFDEGFSVDEAVDYDGETCVIGGGITAGQVASSMAEQGADVNLVSRSEIEKAGEEADEEWQNWTGIKERLDGKDQEESYESIREARYDGAMPEYVHEKLVESSTDISEDVEILNADYTDGIDIELSDGETAEDVQLVYATGFQDAYEDNFYQNIADELGLATGFRDMPMLEDEGLEWLDEYGDNSDIYVTGEMAQGNLGPFAGNIRGAQIASEIIGDELTEDVLEPITASQEASTPTSSQKISAI